MGRSPWADLEERDDIVVVRADLGRKPEGYSKWVGIGWVIVLDSSLTPEEAEAVRRHEYEHIRHGGGIDHPGMPRTWKPVVVKEERACDRATADDYLPPIALDAWIRRQESVSARFVADTFGVADWVAQRALDDAVQRAARRHPAA